MSECVPSSELGARDEHMGDPPGRTLRNVCFSGTG